MQRTTVINRKNALKVVKELDAFPKVPESYQETSASGGGLSIMTFIIIILLIMSELAYYSRTELAFSYRVDTNFTGKIKLNLDITVAMKCHHVGADVLDQTGQDVLGFGQLKSESVYFELSPRQREYQDFIQNLNLYVQNEFHAIQDVLWRSENKQYLVSGMPEREGPKPAMPPDGCRFHGSLEVNKVAGNFHITAGKSVPVIPRGHAHLAIMMDQSDYNFSHRIDHFSFGDPVSGVVYPLDGSEYTTSANLHTFQYFMQVVPTEVRTYLDNIDTYQFAVTQRNRPINHSEGSHGTPGIFVKYDLSSLLIRVEEVHKPYWQFLVRMCGIIGGVFSVSGMINGLIGVLGDIICCRFKWGQYRSPKYDEVVAANNDGSAPLASPLLAPSTSGLPPSTVLTDNPNIPFILQK